MNRKLSFLVILCFLSACKEVIDIPLKNSEPAFVIEGNITNGTNEQKVFISRTVSFDTDAVYNGVSGAEVKVETEGNQIVHFLEQMPGVYVTRSLTGRPGKTYKLHVNVDNKEYSAVSVMPYPVPMDTLRLTLTTFMNNQNKSIEVTYKDSLGVANYYRFQLFVNDIPSKKIFVSSDELSDGKIVSQDLYDFDINLKKDDVVEVWMENIDKNVYRYWLGLRLNGSRGAASTTPANPVSNISGGALGYFSAHTVQRRQTVVP